MKKIIYILLISPLFWGISCYKCDETVAKFQFKPQDYEWQIYDLNQTYSFKSTKTGEVKTYSVIKTNKSIFRSKDGVDKWGCTIRSRQTDIITIEMVNSNQEKIVVEFQALDKLNQHGYDISSTKESHFLIRVQFYDSSSNLLKNVGYPIYYINKYQSSFINAQPLSPDSNSPYHFIIFYNQLEVNGFTYQDVFKKSDCYYSKTWGIIQFTLNDETWQRI